eukprot:TRINITY_DN24172_c0_g1_i1.p1 TRINITY_DN24172_c0_g1~~TRINITY_DN24172_c0_g1_i1.p1  ORF type:complete len:399 (-),score=104.99 TRINITY_DN24172_c0_g1_i1:101-1297(-)
MMVTPNGRFQTDTALCLSMSDFHPESWNPMWSVSTILTGVLSFMLEETPTTGALESGSVTNAQREQLASQSMVHNLRDPVFRKHFPHMEQAAAPGNTTATSEEHDPSALKQRGNLAFKRGDWRAAVDAYQTALSCTDLVTPQMAAILHSNMAACELELGAPREAMNQALESLELDPCYTKAHGKAVRACLDLGDLAAARYHLVQMATAASPDDLAKLEKSEQGMSQALRDGEAAMPKAAALQMAEVTQLCRASVAMELQRAGWLAQAGELLAAVDAAQLASKAARRGGGVMLSSEGEWVAVGDKPTQLEESIKLASTKRELGNHRFKAGDWEGAVAEYSLGIEACPRCSPLRCNRGTAFMKLGRRHEAMADFEMAVELDSQYTKARQRLQECQQGSGS